jgi:hypothetical protein
LYFFIFKRLFLREEGKKNSRQTLHEIQFFSNEKIFAGLREHGARQRRCVRERERERERVRVRERKRKRKRKRKREREMSGERERGGRPPDSSILTAPGMI